MKDVVHPSVGNPTVHSGEIRTRIADGLVSLFKEYYGRGPDRAKTYYNDDLVVCLLRGGFTRVEQTLLDRGRGAAVIEQRMAFQEVMMDRFAEVVESATGRKVVGFMSGNQQDPDIICEVFVLDSNDLITADAPGVESSRSSRESRESSQPPTSQRRT